MVKNKLTQVEIERKIKAVKNIYAQKLFNQKISVEILEDVKKELVSKDEPENYYQAEAIRQAIEWYNEVIETGN